MRPNTTIQAARLTVEEIETQERFRHLSYEQKQALIEFVFQMSLALYHSHRKQNEQH